MLKSTVESKGYANIAIVISISLGENSLICWVYLLSFMSLHFFPFFGPVGLRAHIEWELCVPIWNFCADLNKYLSSQSPDQTQVSYRFFRLLGNCCRTPPTIVWYLSSTTRLKVISILSCHPRQLTNSSHIQAPVESFV